MRNVGDHSVAGAGGGSGASTGKYMLIDPANLLHFHDYWYAEQNIYEVAILSSPK